MIDYKNWIKTGKIKNVEEFRNVQIECFEAAEKNKTGLFELTCGAGKTLVQAALINKEFLRAERKNESAVILVASHRLLLNAQLGENYSKFIKNFATRADVYCLCGMNTKNGSDEYISELIDNVKKKDLKNRIKMSRKRKKHVIIITTATSENMYKDDLFSICKSCGLNLYIHDECHKNIDADIIKKANDAAERAYYFTATPGEYVTNSLNTLVKYDFNAALADGIVVPPVLYTLNFTGVADDDHSSKTKQSAEFKAIEAGFKKLIEIEKNNNNCASMIVFLSSIESVDAASKNVSSRLSNVNVYSFASEKKQLNKKGQLIAYGKCKLNNSDVDANGKEWTKESLLEECRKDNGNKIILNAFMLTEGIDLPTINGVLMLCSKEDASLYQAIMRGCRTAKNKNNFALIAPVRFNGKDLLDEDQKFLRKLIYAIGGTLDFGGHIEDQMDGGDDNKDDKKGNILIAEFKKINEAIEASIKEYERFFKEEKTEQDFIDSFYNDLPKKEPMRTEYRINFWKNNMAMIMQYGLTKNILDD